MSVSESQRALFSTACEALEHAEVLVAKGRREDAYRILRDVSMCIEPDSELWYWFGPKLAAVLQLEKE